MASIFDGMFTSPEEVKNKRMQDIMDARTRLSQSGGSMNQLLGQVNTLQFKFTTNYRKRRLVLDLITL